ncbi:hypothetical protein ID866_3585 [Astraeus odoratus]|nr:hypothetical protein ID866_3585 [Astraeus odoratus]
MFTPPPSPSPPPLHTRPASLRPNLVQDERLVPPNNPLFASAAVAMPPKHTVTQRFRWSVILVPVTLIFVAVTTRFLSHPVAFDLLIPGAEKDWDSWTEKIVDWRPHEGHAHMPASRTYAADAPSLLAQNNITAMNIDIWGTCNTVIPWDECSGNMAWFASALQSSCEIDLNDKNAMAMDTLIALQAYDLMRNVSCQVDATTDAYCYVESVASSDPSSYWFYLLPLGQPLVNITESTCNACTKELMATYADALDGSNSTLLTGLHQTYETAAKSLNSACGASYAQVSTSDATTNAALSHAGFPRVAVLLGLFLVPWLFFVL